MQKSIICQLCRQLCEEGSEADGGERKRRGGAEGGSEAFGDLKLNSLSPYETRSIQLSSLRLSQKLTQQFPCRFFAAT